MSVPRSELPLYYALNEVPDFEGYYSGASLSQLFHRLTEQQHPWSATITEVYNPCPSAAYLSYPDGKSTPYEACRIELRDAPDEYATLVLMAGMHLNELAGNNTLAHMAHLATIQPELLVACGIKTLHLIDASPTSVDQQGSWINGPTVPSLTEYLLAMNRFDLMRTDKLYAGGDWSHTFTYEGFENVCTTASSLACKGVIDRALAESDRVGVLSLHNALVGGYGGNLQGFSDQDIQLLVDLTMYVNPKLGPAPQDECTKLDIPPLAPGWYPVIRGIDLAQHYIKQHPSASAEEVAAHVKDTGIGYALAQAKRISRTEKRNISISGALTEPPTHHTGAFSDYSTPSGESLYDAVTKGGAVTRATLETATAYARNAKQEHALAAHIGKLAALWEGENGALRAGEMLLADPKKAATILSKGEAAYREYLHTIFPLYTIGMAARLAMRLGDTRGVYRMREYMEHVVGSFEARVRVTPASAKELVRHQLAATFVAALALHMEAPYLVAPGR